MTRLSGVGELDQYREQLRQAASPHRVCITVCGGTGCRACGGEQVVAAIQEEVDGRGLAGEIEVKLTGCHGLCERGPIVVVQPEGVFYPGLGPEDVSEVVEAVALGRVADQFVYLDPHSGEPVRREEDISFYRQQTRIVLAGNGQIDPTSIADYIVFGGYRALAKALTELDPEKILEQVKRSGLRGRGGAGFPTGKKWEFCQRAAGEKVVICNADEGDPGAYMDRSVLEGNPHLVIEGMIIGAYTVGATEGYVYVRAEYPLAVQHLRMAISQAEELGLLGEDILGSGFCFGLALFEGAGAFVCGEETALMASIEGRRGMPRQRPPFPAQSGLWGRPTNINNVETWANVPAIVARGADWFAEVGTESSRGTKIFSLVGKVNNTGLVEVPMGMTLREVVEEIGGGVPDGKSCKAVQTGGPSGGCIPASHLDLPVDYEQLARAGSIMGSGGLVVMDEDTCMVDLARYFLDFLREESCGKCLPCRVGIPRMLEVLERIVRGEGKEEDLDRLEELGRSVQANSLCGLGQTAPNPVLSTLRYFREEYLAHIRDHACPARVCPSLIRYEVNAELCRGCDACRRACPEEAVVGTPGEGPYRIREHLCVRCGACLRACRFGAISVSAGRTAVRSDG